jgi:hypothetical protein
LRGKIYKNNVGIKNQLDKFDVLVPELEKNSTRAKTEVMKLLKETKNSIITHSEEIKAKSSDRTFGRQEIHDLTSLISEYSKLNPGDKKSIMMIRNQLKKIQTLSEKGKKILKK